MRLTPVGVTKTTVTSQLLRHPFIYARFYRGGRSHHNHHFASRNRSLRAAHLTVANHPRATDGKMPKQHRSAGEVASELRCAVLRTRGKFRRAMLRYLWGVQRDHRMPQRARSSIFQLRNYTAQ